MESSVCLFKIKKNGERGKKGKEENTCSTDAGKKGEIMRGGGGRKGERGKGKESKEVSLRLWFSNEAESCRACRGEK